MLIFAFISGIFIGFVIFMIREAWYENMLNKEVPDVSPEQEEERDDSDR